MTAYGWRIGRVPAKPVRRDADGRVSVPLWLLRDGRYHADLDLLLTSEEAEVLWGQLGQVLGEKGETREGDVALGCSEKGAQSLIYAGELTGYDQSR